MPGEATLYDFEYINATVKGTFRHIGIFSLRTGKTVDWAATEHEALEKIDSLERHVPEKERMAWSR